MESGGRAEVSTIRAWWFCLLTSLLAYGLPVALGSTWFLTTGFPARTDDTRRPAFLMGYDSFSSPQLDLPFREIARQSLANGELPLWNPHTSLGIPLAAQYQNQIFSLFEWIDLILNDNWWWNVTLLLRIALAGFGAFLFVRRLFEDDLTAIFSGTLYILSAYFIGFQSISAFINGAVLLPWMLLAVNKAFIDRSIFPSAALVGVVFGLAVTSGQPQIALLNTGAAATYGFVALCLAPLHQRWRGLVAIAVGALIAVAIAAPQIAAFLEGLQHGYTIHGPGAYFHGGTTKLNLVTPFMPMLLGPIMSPWLGRLFPGQLNHEGFPLILGSGLTLALLWGLVRSVLPAKWLSWRSRILLWWAIGLLVAFLLVVVSGTLGWAYFWAHPWTNRINLPRYGTPVASLMIALIAATGLRAIGQSFSRSTMAVALVGTVALLATLHYMAWPTLTTPLGETNATLRLASILIAEITGWFSLLAFLVVAVARGRVAPGPAAVGCVVIILAEISLNIRFGFDLKSEYWRLATWFGFLFAGGAWAWSRPRWALGSAAVAVILLGWVGVRAPNFLEKARNPYAESVPRLEFLQNHLGPGSIHGRVLTSQWVMTPNTLAAFGVNQMGGLNPLQPILAANWFTSALTTETVDGTLPVGWHGMIEGPNWPGWTDYAENRLIYNFMGVRLLAETSRHELTALGLPDLTLVWDQPDCRIWEDTRAWPRAFLARGSFVSAETNAAAQALALADRFKANFAALAITAPPEAIAPLTTDDALTITNVDVFEQRHNYARIEAKSETAALLVVTDVFYPGWRARLNGMETEIWPVQGLMRGVLVPAGDHVVEFRYAPKWLIPALALMVFGWISVSVVGLLAIRRNYRARPAADRTRAPEKTHVLGPG